MSGTDLTPSTQRDLAGEWMKTADYDLAAANKLASPPNAMLPAASYHCQQAAEKAAKALLVLNGVTAGAVKTYSHDIGKIVSVLRATYPNIVDFQQPAESLSALATEYRYPQANRASLAQAEFDASLADATGIVEFCRARIADHVQATASTAHPSIGGQLLSPHVDEPPTDAATAPSISHPKPR